MQSLSESKRVSTKLMSPRDIYAIQMRKIGEKKSDMLCALTRIIVFY